MMAKRKGRAFYVSDKTETKKVRNRTRTAGGIPASRTARDRSLSFARDARWGMVMGETRKAGDDLWIRR